MLDENLPTFVLKTSTDKPKTHSTFYHSQHGSEFEPSYAVRHLDPDQHASKNRYAAAIYDSFMSDVLYAEVLLIPDWTQPQVTDQARQNGAVPPPPEPILPTEFTIQLYNPDQQVVFRHKPASWNTAASWEFELPQQTFREPSQSALDRTQDDPIASETTPKIGFKWKRDGKFSKDLVCFMARKSNDIEGRKKSKEPDITVSIFKGLKEVTLYEPNLQRVDIEDLKGFEVVLLLGAVVIRDVYFSSSLKEIFNISGTGRRSTPTSPLAAPTALASTSASSHAPTRATRVPPTDPRSQWELDAETERLRREAADEERARRRKEEEAERQVRRMLEEEEKAEKRRRQAEVDRETERLKQLYGNQQRPSTANSSRQSRHHSDSRPSPYPPSQQNLVPQTNSWGGYAGGQGPYMTGAAAQSTSLSPNQPEQRLKQKSSIFSFRRRSDDAAKLQRKRSAVF